MSYSLLRCALIGALAASVVQTASANQPCTNHDFGGTYGEIGWGAIADSSNPLAGPFARVGRALADGNGNVIAHTYGSFNGLIFVAPQPYSGTYTVSPDCMVVFHMNIPVPSPGGPVILPLTLSGSISDTGRDVATMITDPPGLPVRIVFHRQDRENCTVGDFRGAYGLDMFGNMASGVFTRTGRVVFDGQGGFTASTVANYNGAVTPESISGTYTINAECELTMQYTLDQPVTWFGGLYGSSAGSTLMLIDPPGSVVIGTIQQQ